MSAGKVSFGFTIPQRGVFFGIATWPEMIAMAARGGPKSIVRFGVGRRQRDGEAAAGVYLLAGSARGCDLARQARGWMHGEFPDPRSDSVRISMGHARSHLERPHAPRRMHWNCPGRRRQREGRWDLGNHRWAARQPDGREHRDLPPPLERRQRQLRRQVSFVQRSDNQAPPSAAAVPDLDRCESSARAIRKADAPSRENRRRLDDRANLSKDARRVVVEAVGEPPPGREGSGDVSEPRVPQHQHQSTIALPRSRNPSASWKNTTVPFSLRRWSRHGPRPALPHSASSICAICCATARSRSRSESRHGISAASLTAWLTKSCRA